jgi:endogenous inhibitor of DNA gyrase (YacG/DUF329 family)
MSALPPPGTPRARPCPTCGAPQVAAFKPFCSKRCAQVDLHRWLSGAYAIPVVETDSSDAERPDGEGAGSDDRS